MAERTIRSVEERVAELDRKINFHKEKIALLEEKKKNLHSARQQNDLKKESDCPVFLYNVNFSLSLEVIDSPDLCGNSKRQRL